MKKLLIKLQLMVDYSNPHIKSFFKMRNYKFDLNSVELTDQSIAAYDCLKPSFFEKRGVKKWCSACKALKYF